MVDFHRNPNGCSTPDDNWLIFTGIQMVVQPLMIIGFHRWYDKPYKPITREPLSDEFLKKDEKQPKNSYEQWNPDNRPPIRRKHRSDFDSYEEYQEYLKTPGCSWIKKKES